MGVVDQECVWRWFVIVTPGVRPRWAGMDDQRRVMTPGEAMRNGADYVVVGRAVTRDRDPQSAAARLLADIGAELGECECWTSQQL